MPAGTEAGPPSHDPNHGAEPAPRAETISNESPTSSSAHEQSPGAPPSEPVEITVVGSSAARAPGATHVISRRQLERFHYDDPGALLLQAPGVYLRQEDGMGLRPNIGIRGTNADRSKKVTLMEDGILFGPAPYSAPAAYYFPLMARMVSVRVIKGPAAIGYGPQTVAGAIDFVTRPIPDQPSGFVDFALGEYGYNKTHAAFGASSERVGFLVEGVHLQNSGFKVLPNSADTGSVRNDFMVKASYEPELAVAARNRFDVKLSYADEVSNETYLGLSDEDFERDPYQRYAASALDQMKNHRTALVLSHHLDLDSAELKLKTDVYRHDYARVWRKVNRFRGAPISGVLADPEEPANAEYYAVLTGRADGATQADTLLVGPNDRTFISQGVQSVARAHGRTGVVAHSFEAGARLHYDEIERRHSETGYVMTGGRLVAEGTAEVVTAAETESTTALALHALDALSFYDLTLTPGARVELLWTDVDDRLNGTQGSGSVQAVLPGLGAYYGLTQELGVLGGVYRGFSPPPPGSDDHVGPEYSVNYELGARYSKGPRRFELIAYYNDYSNLTDVCTLASGCLSENLDRQFDAGEAEIMGIEAYAGDEWRLGASGLVLPYTLSYSVSRARFENDFTSQDPIFGTVEAGDEIPYVPRHQMRASLGLENEWLGGAAALSYVSASREAAGSEPLSDVVSTDEQVWLDLGARYRVLEKLWLYADVRNVLDAAYIVSRRPYGARPNAPRWVQVGAKLSF